MADSNEGRTDRRQVALYLNSDEVTALARAARESGESRNTILRVALREHLRYLAREKRIGEATAPRTELPPHLEQVAGIECSLYGGTEKRSEDVAAWLRTRLSRDYPRAALKIKVHPTGFARSNLSYAIISGTLTEAEKRRVQTYLDWALRETFEQCQALLG